MTLYSLRSADGHFRIQKFDTDLNPLFDSSYILSELECSCPAGHRSTCRHRQMLPKMLAAELLDSPDFWDHDWSHIVAVDSGQEQSEAAVHNPEPHSPTATTTDFDSVDVGSSPAVATTPAFKRRF